MEGAGSCWGKMWSGDCLHREAHKGNLMMTKEFRRLSHPDPVGKQFGTFDARCSSFSLFNEVCWAVYGGPIQPDLIGIKDENAVLIERDLSGLPARFVAGVGVPTGVTDPDYSDKVIVIGADPFYADATNGRPSFAENCLLLLQCRFLYDG